MTSDLSTQLEEMDFSSPLMVQHAHEGVGSGEYPYALNINQKIINKALHQKLLDGTSS